MNNDDIMRHICSHFLHLEEHYGTPGFCNAYFHSFQDYCLRREHSSWLPSEVEIISFISRNIPWIRPEVHSFFNGLVDLIREYVNSLNDDIRICCTCHPGRRSNWASFVNPKDRARFHDF